MLQGHQLKEKGVLIQYLTLGTPIESNSWLGNWNGKLGNGLKRIYWSGSKPAIIKATGWNHPMFWYESTNANNNGCVLILENIHFELSEFTDSAIRLSNYILPRNNYSSPHGIGNPESNGNNGLFS